MGHPEKNDEKLGVVPDSLIFDMDGTLWDALDTYIRVWNAYLEKNALDIAISRSEMKSWMGLEEVSSWSEYSLNCLLPKERTGTGRSCSSVMKWYPFTAERSTRV